MLLFFAVCLAAPASAIENFGVMGGLDFTQLTGDAPADFRYRGETGFQVGAVVEFALSRQIMLSLQPSFMRSSTAIRFKDRQAGVERDSVSLDLDWIVLPVLFRIKAEQSAFFATGGLDLALGVGGGFRGGSVDEPVDSFVRDLDVAALIGAGVELPAGRWRILAELRYRQGLINIAREGTVPDGSGLPPRFRLAGAQLMAGVMLPLGGAP